jgi:chromate transporter
MKRFPASKSDIFWSFTWLALQGFGGVLPVAQRELVDKKGWYTQEEFLEDWAVAQVLPGPNVVNLAIIFGSRYFGWKGAIAGIAGMLLFPMLVLIAIAFSYQELSGYPVVAGALRGMGAVAAGLIAGASLKMASALKNHPLGYFPASIIGVLCFLAVAIVRVPLIYVLLSLGLFSIYLTYRKIKS